MRIGATVLPHSRIRAQALAGAQRSARRKIPNRIPLTHKGRIFIDGSRPDRWEPLTTALYISEYCRMNHLTHETKE